MDCGLRTIKQFNIDTLARLTPFGLVLNFALEFRPVFYGLDKTICDAHAFTSFTVIS